METPDSISACRTLDLKIIIANVNYEKLGLRHMTNAKSEGLLESLAEGLSEISEEFHDDMDRTPSLMEFLEVLTETLRSSQDDLLEDVHPYNIVALEPTLTKEGEKTSSPRKQGEFIVGDLGDHVFVVAGDVLDDLVRAIKNDRGRAPKLNEICGLLIEGLNKSDEAILSDVEPRQVTAIIAKTKKAKNIRVRIGDIVSISSPKGRFIAVVVAKNSFGTAFGIFKESMSEPRVPSMAAYPPADPHPIYSGDRLIVSGRWKIIGHDEELLSLFPREPEIYHLEKIIEEEPDYGPYGSGETADGVLRELTKEEAEELGLLNGEYRQRYSAEYLEEYLGRKFG